MHGRGARVSATRPFVQEHSSSEDSSTNKDVSGTVSQFRLRTDELSATEHLQQMAKSSGEQRQIILESDAPQPTETADDRERMALEPGAYMLVDLSEGGLCVLRVDRFGQAVSQVCRRSP